jgi:3-oxoadipate enol-lactonase
VSRVAVGQDLALEVVVEGEADAPPLVLIHSAGAEHRMWERNLPAVRDRFRLIRYDARGHGRSDVPSAPYTLDDLGTDLVAVLDALGVASAHVVGASLGGLVALWLAVRHPDRVRGAVFAGAAARFGTAASWEERADIVRRDGTEAVVDLVMRRFFSERFRREEADVVTGFADVLRRQSPEGYIGTCLALRDADLRDEVSAIRAPSLVVVGDEDVSVPPPDAEALSAAIPGARLLVLEGAGHLCTVERPDVFEDIVAYLNEEAG